jgi:hypothetical protein
LPPHLRTDMVRTVMFQQEIQVYVTKGHLVGVIHV